MAKVFERIIYDQLYQYLNENDLLSRHQSGFRSRLSFLLYINDLPNCLQHSQPRIYAYDTSITFAGSDVDEMNNCRILI